MIVLRVKGEVGLGWFGDVGDAGELGSLHAAQALHAAHGVLREPPGQDGCTQAEPVTRCGRHGLLKMHILLAAPQLRQATPLVLAPGCLDERRRPYPPMVRVVPAKMTTSDHINMIEPHQ